MVSFLIKWIVDGKGVRIGYLGLPFTGVSQHTLFLSLVQLRIFCD